jgi:hypothetical protein
LNSLDCRDVCCGWVNNYRLRRRAGRLSEEKSFSGSRQQLACQSLAREKSIASARIKKLRA